MLNKLIKKKDKLLIGISKYSLDGEIEWKNILNSFLDIPFEIIVANSLKPKKLPLDFLIFDGGADVSPSFYGENTETLTHTNYKRDMEERDLFYSYYHSPTKLVGICRGLQFLNVMLNGSLFQDLSSINKKHQHMHDVSIISNTDLSSYVGNEKILVNSLHHQAIKTIGHNLIPTMYASNGIIEGIEYKDFDKIRAVQSHPEMSDSMYTNRFKILRYLFRV